ncbi:DNA/RNA non-specific endonuclease [Pelagicoccus mobilis]|uniref:DNA/RNA non-specific endonuclease n=1 Tax=Pelagicoccus mobilis TaxID=415221 RepID=A0A934VPG1_9BACT|nr:DNA/RNA non-specific endonuclease [Pelagicoccus mobilis]MBK1877252.1 DNA/RNA non-specific endonuclease [Pelagicoccus mobilis]
MSVLKPDSKTRISLYYAIALFLGLNIPFADSQQLQTDGVSEHVYGGLPSSNNLSIRSAYVLDYNSARKAPWWVAYRLDNNYRRTPKRTGKWKTYRNDPDRTDEPSENDYSGVYSDPIRNYARGHLAPYMICGGDRDGDGMILDADRDGKVEEGDDIDEAITVKEINYHTNLTPQHHNAFNGSGGTWYQIENRVRVLQEEHGEVWVLAGPIFGPSTYDEIGNGVQVAPMFFQIIVWEKLDEPHWEAYMLPHHQKAHQSIEEHRVSIRHIEAMTGLDFFPDLALSEKERISTY